MRRIHLNRRLRADIPRERVFVFRQHISLDAPVSETEGQWDGAKSWRAGLGTLELKWDTGLPKAVEMAHYNFIAQHTIVLKYKHYHTQYASLSLLLFHSKYNAFRKQPAGHPTPLYPHIPNRIYHKPSCSGMKTYIMRRFQLEPQLRNINRFQNTEANMVPLMVLSVTNSSPMKKYSLASNAIPGSALHPWPQSHRPANSKALLSADAPSGARAKRAGQRTMLHYPNHDVTGSVGRPLPDYDAKLVDEQGVDYDITNFHVTGEFGEYFKNPEANRRAWDEEVILFLVMWSRGGAKLGCELEGVLLPHLEISDVAVMVLRLMVQEHILPSKMGKAESATDTKLHERSISWIQAVSGRRKVKFVDAKPKNASGKIWY
ncbi:hypothetical protein J1614_002847, partial [Plenodomus biglobosus]